MAGGYVPPPPRLPPPKKPKVRVSGDFAIPSGCVHVWPDGVCGRPNTRSKNGLGWWWSETPCDVDACGFVWAHGLGEWFGNNGAYYLGRMVRGSRESCPYIISTGKMCVNGVWYEGAFSGNELHGDVKVGATADLAEHQVVQFNKGWALASAWQAAVDFLKRK